MGILAVHVNTEYINLSIYTAQFAQFSLILRALVIKLEELT